MTTHVQARIALPHLVVSQGQYASIIILIIGSLVYLFNVYQQQNAILDDGYITFRFAEHLAHGQGLVWNVDGEPVEGFTSLFHVSLLAAAIKVGIPPQAASNGISIGAVLGTVFLLVSTLRSQFGYLFPPAVLVVAIYLSDGTTAFHSISGLETQLFVFFLCLAYVISLSFLESPRRRTAVILALVIFLSLLCRPEGFLNGFATYAVLFVYTGVLVRSKNQKAGEFVGNLLISVVLLSGLGIAYAAWKYTYFGYLLPNSFYVKSNQLGLSGLYEVLKYLLHVAAWVSPLLLGFVLMFSPGSIATYFRKPTLIAKALLTIVPALVALLYYSTIIHEVGGAHRFSYPTYFYIVMTVAACFSLANRSALSTKSHAFQDVIVVLVCLLILVTRHGAYRLIDLPWQINPHDESQLRIARSLESTGLGARATVISIAAGVIPYISHFNHVDPVGLTDNVLSGRIPLTPTEREAYLWSTNADVYFGFEPQASVGVLRMEDDPRMQSSYVRGLMDPAHFNLVGERMFLRNPALLFRRMRELTDNWYWVGEIEWPGWSLWRLKKFVYVRRDSPYFDELVRELEKIVVHKPSEITFD